MSMVYCRSVALKMEQTFIILLSGLALVTAAVPLRPNFDGCVRCNDLYQSWSLNRTSTNFWSDSEGAIEAADRICSWGEHIRDTCFDVCALSPYNQTMESTERRALLLKKFLNKECLDHKCRVADLAYCERQNGGTCRDGSWQCKYAHLADVDCKAEAEEPRSLCLPAQRRLWAEMLKDEASCYFSSSNIKKRGLAPTELTQQQGWGLQHCKDMLISGCVQDWHINTIQLDMDNFAQLEAAQWDKICSQKVDAFKCFDNLDSDAGLIEYQGYNYTAPCNQSLMENPDKFAQAREDMKAVYNAICTDRFPETCADIWNTTTKYKPQNYTPVIHSAESPNNTQVSNSGESFNNTQVSHGHVSAFDRNSNGGNSAVSVSTGPRKILLVITSAILLAWDCC